LRPLAAALPLIVLGIIALGGTPAAGATLDELAAELNLTPLHGAAPPPLALERLTDGKTIVLPYLRGRPVLVYFWATW
jgi:thiol-disulfide isomerase/thioredoxin